MLCQNGFLQFTKIVNTRQDSMSRPRPRRSKTISQKITSIQNDNPDIFYTDDDIKGPNSQCRICLEGYIPGNRLIAPCKCTGSVQYIHEQCMKQWIEKNRQKKIDPIRCELCKQIIVYSVVNERQCNKWQVVKQRIYINYKIFLFLLFLFLINCGVTVYLIVLFVHIIKASKVDPKFIQIGVISFSIALLLVISSLLFGIIIREFVYSEKRKVSGVMSMMNNPRKFSQNTSYAHINESKAKVHPMEITQIEEDG